MNRRFFWTRVATGRLAGLLLVLFVLFPEAEARGAAVRYVATKGTDTGNLACTQTAPCRTVMHAVDVADPGDTISIGKGKFVEEFGVVIDKNLTLNGAGIFSTRVGYTWSGFSVFRIGFGVSVAISGLDVQGGQAPWGSGGGISNFGDLTLTRVRVRKNSAKGSGGGIFNWDDGQLNIFKSEISANVSAEGGGGLHNQGFAVLDEVLISANHAALGSGGIQNSSGADATNLFVSHSLISHNSGDGINNWGGISLTNTTVSNNAQVGIVTGSGGATKLTHVTVAENGNGPGQYADVSRGGLAGQAGSTLEFFNTIVANNAVTQCSVPDEGVSALGSLVSDLSCKLWPGGGNLVGVDPRLGPLTWSHPGTRLVRTTHALKHGSPAIDAALPASCTSDDQRGVSRWIDGNKDGVAGCDIGAFEYSPLKRKSFGTDLGAGAESSP